MKKPFFKDLGDLDEDARIDKIGYHVHVLGQRIAFVVDTGKGYEGKGDRYIKKLLDKFPDIKVCGRVNGPTEHSETIMVEPK